MPSTIANAKNVPLNVKQGSVPDVSGSLKDTFQQMVFTQILKASDGFQAVEIPTNTAFEGNIQPFKPRELQLLPEGQRAWSWYRLFADPVLNLQVDDVVTYLGTQTRVMAKFNYTQNGYIEYHMVQDWTGSGPNPSPPINPSWDGGGAFTSQWPNTADGGNANVD